MTSLNPKPDEASLARAEEVVTRVGTVVGDWASRLGFDLLKAAARAREEAEDVWAEAQALSRDGEPADS